MATEIERETVPIKTQTLETLPYSLPGPTEDQPLSPVKPDESKKTEATTAVATVPATTDSPPVSNEAPNSLQKKMRRAERFGVRVQLSEKEKRNSRAHRFGMGVSSNGSNALKNSNGSDALKRSEELKRKVRAERFGLPVQSVVDEEVKKKARLARFASVPKTGVEDDKRKARAIRFFTNSSCPSTSDGEANSQKANVAPSAPPYGAPPQVHPPPQQESPYYPPPRQESPYYPPGPYPRTYPPPY